MIRPTCSKNSKPGNGRQCVQFCDEVLSLNNQGILPLTEKALTLHLFRGMSDKKAPVFPLLGGMLHLFASTLHQKASSLHLKASTLHLFASALYQKGSALHLFASTLHQKASGLHLKGASLMLFARIRQKKPRSLCPGLFELSYCFFFRVPPWESCT